MRKIKKKTVTTLKKSRIFAWFRAAMQDGRTNVININFKKIPDHIINAPATSNKHLRQELGEIAVMLALFRKVKITNNKEAAMSEDELLATAAYFIAFWHIEKTRRNGLLDYTGGNPLDPTIPVKIKTGDNVIEGITNYLQMNSKEKQLPHT